MGLAAFVRAPVLFVVRSSLALVFALTLGLSACESESGDGEPFNSVDAGSDASVDSLFGDWGDTGASDGDASPGDQTATDLPDGQESVAPDALIPDGSSEAQETFPEVEPEVEEVYVPVDWDVMVLTGAKGHLYRNGAYYAVVPNHSDASFTAVDGLFSEVYTLTSDGQGRRDTDPLFKVEGSAANATFLDIAVSMGLGGFNAFTIESNGEVRNNGGHLMTVPNPGGESFVAIAAGPASDDFYLATDAGRILKKNVVHGVAFPVSAADPLVAMRIESDQFYGLTRDGKIYKNAAVVLDLAGKADPPFVGLDVTPEHVYAVTRSCAVFKDTLKVHEIQPFTGDYCVGVAGVHSLY